MDSAVGLALKLSLPRAEIDNMLRQKPWFGASTLSIQNRILGLGDECIGFLQFLAHFPVEIGGVRVIKIEDLLIPDAQIYGIFPVFLVQNLKDPTKVYRYQFFSWRQGPMSGNKGLALINDGSKVTHIVLLLGDKFAVGGPCFDAIGGFGNGGRESFLSELHQELGLPKLEIASTIPLGHIYTDPGMTNNYPELSAAVILLPDATDLLKEETPDNPDPWELRSGKVIVKIEDLNRFISACDDGFTLACIARLLAKGIIKIPPN